MTRNSLFIWHQITRMCRRNTRLMAMAVACSMLLWAQTIHAQAPKQLEVDNVQGINFGSFYLGGTGGSLIIGVSLTSEVTYTTTGTIVSVGPQGTPALFDVIVLPNRTINILLQPSAVLSHTQLSSTLTLIPGPTNRGNSFVSSGGNPFRNRVIIGGTLEVDGGSPAGNYFGTFSVTFIQE